MSWWTKIRHVVEQPFKSAAQIPFIQPVLDAAALATGNPELLPLINGGLTYAKTGSLGQGLTSGAEAFGAQELAPVLGNVFQSVAPETAASLGIGGGANSLTDLLGQTTGGGSLAGPGTIGGDLLGNFTPGSGLESLFGGTAQPQSNFAAVYPKLGSVSTPDVAAQATSPGNFAAGGDYGAGGTPVPGASVGPGSFTPAGGTGASSLAGGGSGGGFDLASAGESSALPSATGAGIGGTPPSQDFFSGLTGPSNAGSFNYDIGGNPAGASSYSIPQQFAQAAAPAAGGSSVIPSSGGYGSLLSGLLRAGVTGALNNPNNKGYDAQINAGNQIQQLYQPFVNSGAEATSSLDSLLGLNGTTAAQQAAAQGNWQNTPGYQFALDQGMKSVNADAAAKGQLLSGNNQQAIQQYGTGLANQTYNNYLNNLLGQQQLGANAAGGVATGMAGVGNAQAGKSGAGAANQNNTVAGIANALFPSQNPLLSLLGGGAANSNQPNGVLNYLFG